MKNSYDIRMILICILASVAMACEDVVQVEIDEKDLDLISVEAYLTTNHTNNILVKLEKSLPVNQDKENPPINGALVEITEKDNVNKRIELVEDGQSGIYKIAASETFEALPGKTYELNITTPDGVLIRAEDQLTKVETLDTVKVHLSARGDYKYLAVFISSQETPGIGNYYKWDIYINNNLLYGSEDLAFANDELVDGNYIYDLEIFTDWFDEDDDADDRVIFLGDTISVVQASISREAYEFYLGMQNQAFSGSPFSVPPANLPGNFTASNGKKVLGLFSARDISVGNRVVVDSSNFTPLQPDF